MTSIDGASKPQKVKNGDIQNMKVIKSFIGVYGE